MAVEDVSTRRCGRCKEHKTVESFTGSARYCKPCNVEYRREHYINNRERIKESMRQWRLANLEKKRAMDRAYGRANRARIRERQREYGKLNLARANEYKTAWRNANIEKQRQAEQRYRERNREECGGRIRKWKGRNKPLLAFYSRTRQARQIQATPTWADVDAIKAIYREAGRRRKDTGQRWHVDHIVPLISPLVCGLHVPANLQILPGPENESKNNRHWPDQP